MRSLGWIVWRNEPFKAQLCRSTTEGRAKGQFKQLSPSVQAQSEVVEVFTLSDREQCLLSDDS